MAPHTFGPPGLERCAGGTFQGDDVLLRVKSSILRGTHTQSAPLPVPCGPLLPPGFEDTPLPPGLEDTDCSAAAEDEGGTFQGDDVLFREPAASRGSVLHGDGRCVPCAWYWKAEGCRSGAACRRCHLCPAGEIKARRKVKNSLLRGMSKQSVPPAPWLPSPPPGLEDTDGSGSSAAAEDEGIMGAAAQKPVDLRGFLDQSGAFVEKQLSETSSEQDLTGIVMPEAVGLRGILLRSNLPMEEKMGPPGLCGQAPARVMEPMLSSGSVLHSLGRCEPCAWFWRPGGCRSGQECRRCHLCPEGEVKARRKAKNVALKVILGKMTSHGVTIHIH